MSKTVILADKTELTSLEVSGATQYIQGSNRDALTFIFPASEGMEILDAAFSPDNCETITIRDGSEEYTHSGYTVRGSLSKAPVLVTPETADAPAVYEDRITVTMGQRSYAEAQILAIRKQVEDTATQMTDTQMALCEVYEMMLVSGEEVTTDG